ncbi:MAG: CDP-alcohol phosphatidyltransferase family protein [Candidatus Eisenbacteria bacterium]|uniref:CDP-alcohol phosphatidyltransferase family protein n=1 Tax=Eiseniibacteriota bacterium TaxID=2212470 RepID=A0A849SVV3_UNCEI|nr:CDP-alcohol phosphatidyltransferase family protein [Candidatus Eisenbacteria bacterium]
MFVEEHLRELRSQRFAPAALVAYARQVGAIARHNMVANPGAVRSVWVAGLAFFAAAFVAAVAMAVAYDRALAYDFLLQTSFGVLPACALVSLGIGQLRNREGYTLSAINVPIALTMLRLALTPALVLFLLDGHAALALVTFVVVGLTDVADGWLARRWNQETQLGRMIDPVVDIVSNLALFLALLASHTLPIWVASWAIARYAVLLIGGSYLYLFVGPVRIHPTVFGRATGIVMAALVGLVLLLRTFEGRTAEILRPLTEVALGVLLAATVIHAVVLGWYNLRLLTGRAREASGRVVGDVRYGPR